MKFMMMTTARWMAAAVVAVTAQVAIAQEAPTALAGSTLVSAEKVKELQAKGAPVIDVREASEFAEGHVKGAVSVPYKEKSAKTADFDTGSDKFDLSKLPADKNVPIVMYCSGVKCWKSFKAGTVAMKNGYKNIQWFRGGFPEWKEKGYPTE